MSSVTNTPDFQSIIKQSTTHHRELLNHVKSIEKQFKLAKKHFNKETTRLEKIITRLEKEKLAAAKIATNAPTTAPTTAPTKAASDVASTVSSKTHQLSKSHQQASTNSAITCPLITEKKLSELLNLDEFVSEKGLFQKLRMYCKKKKLLTKESSIVQLNQPLQEILELSTFEIDLNILEEKIAKMYSSKSSSGGSDDDSNEESLSDLDIVEPKSYDLDSDVEFKVDSDSSDGLIDVDYVDSGNVAAK